MILELLPPGAPAPLRHPLSGPLTLGGSQTDRIRVAGLPPGAMRLEPGPAGVVLSPAVGGLRVRGRPVAPGSRRLLRPGERARFLDVALSLPPPRLTDRTRVAAAALLRGASLDPAAPPGPHLVVLSGPEAGARAALGTELVVGRGRGADLRLCDAAASRRHARLRAGDAGVTAEDLGAKNRLRVNGVPVERAPIALRAGDVLTVGETELAFEDARAAPFVLARETAPPTAWAASAAVARRPSDGAARPSAASVRPLVAAALLAGSAVALAAMASCG